jgi:16S rRNA (adenine1518-N6/adenine1519-N6)-dimethyltransferase
MNYLKKSLGQNFLIDKNIVKKISNLIDIKDKNILEIGPGKGFLTDQILSKKPKSLIIVEKDNLLSKYLKQKYEKNRLVTIYNNDILKFDLDKKLKRNTIIFGNLPYNISSQILVKVIRLKANIKRYSALIFMFQKELADRIVGEFGTSNYGRLSILVSYKLNIIKKFNVSPNCFFPKPKVNSSVLYLKPHNLTNYKIKNIQNLEKITNILFSNQRKMINKGIKKIFDKEKKIKLIKNLDLNSRPSELNPDKYYEITEIFEKFLKN